MRRIRKRYRNRNRHNRTTTPTQHNITRRQAHGDRHRETEMKRDENEKGRDMREERETHIQLNTVTLHHLTFS